MHVLYPVPKWAQVGKCIARFYWEAMNLGDKRLEVSARCVANALKTKTLRLSNSIGTRQFPRSDLSSCTVM